MGICLKESMNLSVGIGAVIVIQLTFAAMQRGEPMDDLISRQAAIDAINRLDIPEDMCVFEILSHIELELGTLPSAQPEQRWIPCSERLPGEHEWLGTKKFGTTISNEVYVTFEAPDGQRFAKHISFQNGKLSPVDEQRMKVLFKGAKPIAWMPLPEPYDAKVRIRNE